MAAVAAMARGGAGGQGDALVVQREHELKEAYEARVRVMEEAIREKDEEVLTHKRRFDKIKEDFTYNLKLLQDRDNELRQYDESFKLVQKVVEEREQELVQMRGTVTELEALLQRERDTGATREAEFQRQLVEMQHEIERVRVDKDKELQVLREHIESQRREMIHKAQSQADALDAQRRELVHAFEEAQRKRADTHAAVEARLREELVAKEAAARSLKFELEAAQADFARLKAGLDSLHHNAQDSETRHQSAVQQLQQQLHEKSLETQRAQQQQQLAEAAAKESQLEAERARKWVEAELASAERRVAAEQERHRRELQELMERHQLEHRRLAERAEQQEALGQKRLRSAEAERDEARAAFHRVQAELEALRAVSPRRAAPTEAERQHFEQQIVSLRAQVSERDAQVLEERSRPAMPPKAAAATAGDALFPGDLGPASPVASLRSFALPPTGDVEARESVGPTVATAAVAARASLRPPELAIDVQPASAPAASGSDAGVLRARITELEQANSALRQVVTDMRDEVARVKQSVSGASDPASNRGMQWAERVVQHNALLMRRIQELELAQRNASEAGPASALTSGPSAASVTAAPPAAAAWSVLRDSERQELLALRAAVAELLKRQVGGGAQKRQPAAAAGQGGEREDGGATRMQSATAAIPHETGAVLQTQLAHANEQNEKLAAQLRESRKRLQRVAEEREKLLQLSTRLRADLRKAQEAQPPPALPVSATAGQPLTSSAFFAQLPLFAPSEAASAAAAAATSIQREAVLLQPLGSGGGDNGVSGGSGGGGRDGNRAPDSSLVMAAAASASSDLDKLLASGPPSVPQRTLDKLSAAHVSEAGASQRAELARGDLRSANWAPEVAVGAAQNPEPDKARVSSASRGRYRGWEDMPVAPTNHVPLDSMEQGIRALVRDSRRLQSELRELSVSTAERESLALSGQTVTVGERRAPVSVSARQTPSQANVEERLRTLKRRRDALLDRRREAVARAFGKPRAASQADDVADAGAIGGGGGGER